MRHEEGYRQKLNPPGPPDKTLKTVEQYERPTAFLVGPRAVSFLTRPGPDGPSDVLGIILKYPGEAFDSLDRQLSEMSE